MSIQTRSLVEDFQATLPWPMDAFQVEAAEKLDAGMGVLVSAPTSSGKTVVAESPTNLMWRGAWTITSSHTEPRGKSSM